MPEGVRTIRVRQYTGVIYDLLKAYADQRKRTTKRVHVVHRRTVWSIKEARTRLERLFGSLPDWSSLDALIGQFASRSEDFKTVTAASLGAALELTREGKLELQQAEPYAKLYLRAKSHLRLVEGGET